MLHRKSGGKTLPLGFVGAVAATRVSEGVLLLNANASTEDTAR